MSVLWQAVRAEQHSKARRSVPEQDDSPAHGEHAIARRPGGWHSAQLSCSGICYRGSATPAVPTPTRDQRRTTSDQPAAPPQHAQPAAVRSAQCLPDLLKHTFLLAVAVTCEPALAVERGRGQPACCVQPRTRGACSRASAPSALRPPRPPPSTSSARLSR